MDTRKWGCVFVLALILLPAAVSHADTVINAGIITQGVGDDYVWFPAGGDHANISYEAGGIEDAVITDNDDGTLTTTSRGDDGTKGNNDNGLVTYNINFANAADYFMYFNFGKITDDSVFVNHGTGFGTVPGKDGSESWNSLDNGWNGLFEIGTDLGDNSSYSVPAGDPAFGWHVAEASTVSFTVRNREDGVLWKDFVFSQQDDLTSVQLDSIIGILPPEPLPPVSPFPFSYDSAAKNGAGTIISGMLDTTGAGGTGDVLFTGVLPDPNFFDPHADDEPPITPAGSIGTVTEPFAEGDDEGNVDGRMAGITWDGMGPVTLTGTDGVNNYSVEAELIFGPSGDSGYNNPTEDRLSSYHPESGEFFDYEWQINVSDDALAEHGGDAVSPGDGDNPRMAVYYGVGLEEPNGLAHRLTQIEREFVVGPDAAYTNTDNTAGDDARWSKYAAYQPLSLYYGWRDRDNIGGGSYQVDSMAFSGNLPVDLTAMTSTVVPEPGTLTLGALALMLLGGYGWRRRRRA